MFCRNCGENNSDSFKFCQFCGTLLSEETSEPIVEARCATVETASESGSSVLDDWLIEEDDGSLSADMLEGKVDEGESGAPLRSKTVKGAAAAQILALNSEDKSGESEFEDDEDDEYEDEDDEDDEYEDEDDEDEEDVEETPASAPVSQRICRQCGEEVAQGHRFCGACGAKYEEELASGGEEDVRSESGNKRTVERPSFVFNSAMPTEQKLAQFRLHQINDDGTVGDLIPLYEGENVVGRVSAPSLSNDRFVNPKHVKITCHDDVAILEDNNSLNGVFLRLSKTSSEIFDGDTFRIGEELINYCHGSSSQPILTKRAEEQTKLIGGKEGEGWGYLRVIIGAFAEGSVYRLAKETVKIGRTQGEIVFARDGFVSGSHATISRQGDHALLTDLGSSNGTFLRIKGPLTVTETAHILIGNKLLRIARVDRAS